MWKYTGGGKRLASAFFSLLQLIIIIIEMEQSNGPHG